LVNSFQFISFVAFKTIIGDFTLFIYKPHKKAQTLSQRNFSHGQNSQPPYPRRPSPCPLIHPDPPTIRPTQATATTRSSQWKREKKSNEREREREREREKRVVRTENSS
jgi:hypothetical protein